MENLSKEIIKRYKYPRTPHLVCSLGRTKDDRVLKDYSIFEGKEVVATLKLDGENSTFYSDGYMHARSLDSQNHESRNWIKNTITPKALDLPIGWRMCGENVYAKHSIEYKHLQSYFYLFSLWNEKNECLSWDDTVEWTKLLGILTVRFIYRGIFHQGVIENLYQDRCDGNEMEGFVLRNANSFKYSDFSKNVGKFVRAHHVQSSSHWMQEKIQKNMLTVKN